MRKNCFSLLGIVLVVLLFVSACVKEETETIEQGVPAPTIYASQENTPDTRSSITVNSEGVGKILWSPADEISVFYGASTGVLYTSTNTEPAAEAAFTTTAIIGSNEGSSSNIWGLYPYNSSAVCDGSSVTTTLPATQYGVPGTFDDDLFVTIAHSTSTNLHFFNVCGGIKFSLSRDDISSITFAGNNDEDLAGDISVSFVDDLPSVSVINGQKTITLTPKEGETFAANTDYYIITLPQSLTGGFTMTFQTQAQLGTFNYTATTVSLKRSVFSKKANINEYAEFSIPTNTIRYTTSDGNVIQKDMSARSNVYYDNYGLLTFYSEVSTIYNNAFRGNDNLISIEFPNSVRNVFESVFAQCSALRTVIIPNGVVSFGNDCFSDCSSLETISFPNSVTSIGSDFFFNCGKLKTIHLSNNLSSIPSMAFGWCTSLERITIPESVTSIGQNAFRKCTSLKSIEIPNNVTSIDNAAFCYCSSLKTIIIPEHVTRLGYDLFEGCSTLQSITILAVNPPADSDENMFYGTTCPIYVPASSVEAYKTANGWSRYADRIQAIPAPIPTPEAVDLGLTVKWASFNLGASSPEEYGDYYAWGETETKTNFSWATYKWCNGTETSLTKYNTLSDFGSVDNKVTLDMEDDAAHVNLGGDWRMPTHSEIDDLIKNCSAVWTTENGIEGYRFTSKKAGYTNKSIFFPAAGGFWNASVNQVGNRGIYRSSSLNVINGNEPTSAICFCYYPDDIYWNGFARWVGFPIRPVCP